MNVASTTCRSLGDLDSLRTSAERSTTSTHEKQPQSADTLAVHRRTKSCELFSLETLRAMDSRSKVRYELHEPWRGPLSEKVLGEFEPVSRANYRMIEDFAKKNGLSFKRASEMIDGLERHAEAKFYNEYRKKQKTGKPPVWNALCDIREYLHCIPPSVKTPTAASLAQALHTIEGSDVT